ncbi:MAG: VWA domain-containing protein [Candidatus Liptonbacteria bacterium]|nr:VWA domain-containing protein [Candidatus Liptonbacteria bacterium]
MRGLILLVALFLSAFFPGPILAQQPFKSSVDLVVLNVTVIDGSARGDKPRFVRGLAEKDFVVYENGIGQDIAFFTQSDVPIEIALIIDTSASMTDKMQMAKEAAIGFIRNLRPQDSAEILGCDARIRIFQTFTNDKDKLEKSIELISAGGSTSLYNAIYVAVNEFKKNRGSSNDIRRQAIVVLSDGEDTSSLITFDESLQTAQKANIAIYAISLKSGPITTTSRRYFNQSDFVMTRFASETGGRSISAIRPEDLRDIYSNILDEIMSQYTIGYESSNKIADGKWRAVIVQALKPNVTVRTRKGYEGPTPSGVRDKEKSK